MAKRYDNWTTGLLAVIRAAWPSFRNKHDKLAFAVHSSFLNTGYYLTAAGKDDGALTSSAFTEEEVGIDRWNEMEGEYRFVYATDARDFKKKVQVKCIATTDNKLMVDAVALEEDGAHMEIGMDVDAYATEDSGNNNYSDHYKNLEKFVQSLAP